MGQRCSNETGNVKGNGAGSKRPLVLPECVSDSFDQLQRPLCQGSVVEHRRLAQPPLQSEVPRWLRLKYRTLS